LTALALFVIWSNSFVAIEYLLAGPAPAFDWLGLTVARFLPASAACGLYCLVRRRSESAGIVRAHWPRLLACGALGVPLYNFALVLGQQLGVPAPVASLTTTLAPLFIMVLAAVFLGERPTVRLVTGLAVAVGGMLVIAGARAEGAVVEYSWAVAITALAPLSWAVYSVLSKPLAGRVSPVLWSYLAISFGGLMILPLLPGRVWSQWVALDARGWVALEYLTFPCTVVGFALWTWLLRHLPAGAVGLTVFLNPPLTTLSKWTLSQVAPAAFQFSIGPREWIGGTLVLAGLVVGVSWSTRSAPGATPAEATRSS
jgi:drug/metabolite transporter (DMT)-like permease